MISDNNQHLDEDQLIQALVDKTDLRQDLRKHLSQCGHCSERKRHMEEDLLQLGRMAERLSPSPRRKVQLPAKQPYRTIQWSWRWRTALGVAAAAVFMLFVINLPPLFKPEPVVKIAPITQEKIEDEALMTEVSRLSENALPQEYMDMIGESDEDSEEDFMDFLIPSLEDETVSLIMMNIFGGMLC